MYTLGRGFFFVQFCDIENLANVSKNISKISQIYSRKKKFCFFWLKNLQKLLKTINAWDYQKIIILKHQTFMIASQEYRRMLVFFNFHIWFVTKFG
jgi:hypothetical protein